MAAVGDRRDDTSWVVVELTRSGELRAEEGTLDRYLQEGLQTPGHKVFIPATTYVRNGKRITIHLMEGYAFVASGLPETLYFALERDCIHVKKVLCTPGPGGIPVLSVLSDTDVQEMKTQLRTVISEDINAGMRVMITQGTYAKLDGEVLEVGEEDAQVLIELRSFKVIRSIPRVFLEPMTEGGEG